MARSPTTRPNWVAGALASVWLVIVAVPILTMVSWSLQRRSDFLDNGPLSPPADPTLANLTDVLDSGFLTYLTNTLTVTAATIVLTLLLAVPCAYAILRSRSWVAGTAFRMFLLGLAIPAQAVIIPLFLIINRMRLYDSLTAVVLPTVAFGLPLVVLVLTGALRDITPDLYEAMTVDGASPLRILLSLVVPLSKGGVIAASIYSGLNAWNGFLFPLILTQDKENRVLTLGLQNYREEFGINMPGMMMAVLLTAMPVFVLYLVARRWLVAGLAGAGSK